MRDTTVTLYKGVNLNPGTNDTLYFENANAQNTYFANKSVGSFPGYIYQRENRNTIRVGHNIRGLSTVNYLSFVNTSYENKKYYAFVTEVNYINENTTEFVYTIDYVQTWLTGLVSENQNVFVERCHTTADDNQAFTISDSLELGDSVTMPQYSDNTNDIFDNLVVVIQATFDIKTWVNGNFQASAKQLPPFTFRNDLADNTSLCFMRYSIGRGITAPSGSALPTFLYHINEASSGVTYDDILNIWIYPSALITGNSSTVIGTSTVSSEFNKVYFDVTANYKVWTPTHSDITTMTLDGHTIVNEKLRSSPYMNCYITNNNGNSVSYDIHKFQNNELHFLLTGNSTPDGKVRILPLNYKNNNSYNKLTGVVNFTKVDFDEALDLQMPSLQLTGSSYEIWLAQNRNVIDNNFDEMRRDMALQTGAWAFGGIVGAVGGGASSLISSVPGYASMGVSQYDTISRSIAQTKDMKLRPNTTKGVQSDGMALQFNKLGFTLYIKTIDNAHAQSIDSYFSMFGYPRKTVLNLNLHARTNYTYVKTVGFIPQTQMPMQDEEVISQMFDNGIRFWVNPSNVGNYGVSNAPLT